MGKLRVLSAKEVVKILSGYGFTQIRQTGSHIVMQRKTADSTVTAIVPNHKELKIGTLQSVIRQSKLPRNVFEQEK